mmetsp:Transcript_196/g.536  ORF Transcript_196/g.536 Transcript_196/m.536 type:complete len:368 (-) Transcript_196:210-1313(-)
MSIAPSSCTSSCARFPCSLGDFFAESFGDLESKRPPAARASSTVGTKLPSGLTKRTCTKVGLTSLPYPTITSPPEQKLAERMRGSSLDSSFAGSRATRTQQSGVVERTGCAAAFFLPFLAAEGSSSFHINSTPAAVSARKTYTPSATSDGGNCLQKLIAFTGFSRANDCRHPSPRGEGGVCHSEMCRSPEEEATSLSSGEKQRHFTASAWPARRPTRFHSLSVTSLSMLEPSITDVEVEVSASRCTAALLDLCAAVCSPLFTSQQLTSRSSPALSNSAPEAEWQKATSCTACVWPCSSWTISPRAMSQITTIPASLPIASMPSASSWFLQATHVHRDVRCVGRAKLLLRVDVAVSNTDSLPSEETLA